MAFKIWARGTPRALAASAGVTCLTPLRYRIGGSLTDEGSGRHPGSDRGGRFCRRLDGHRLQELAEAVREIEPQRRHLELPRLLLNEAREILNERAPERPATLCAKLTDEGVIGRIP